MAAISFDPARQLTLYFRVARDGSKTFSFVDANGTAKDVSGYSFAFSFKYRASDSSNVFSIANGDLTRPSTDKITIPVSSTLTNVAPQEYYWQMDVTLPDTKVHTWLTGSAKFHNGEFDGIIESSTITVDESGSAVTISITGGAGTVSSFSAGNLSPLFTSNVADPTTTPALTFAQVNQNANLIFAGPTNGAAAAPTFRSLVAADIPALPYWPLAGSAVLTNDFDITLNGTNTHNFKANDTAIQFRSVVTGFNEYSNIYSGGTNALISRFNSVGPVFNYMNVSDAGVDFVTNALSFTIGGSPGTNGQVLTSNGTNATWATPAVGGSSVFSDLIAATGTNTINNAGYAQEWQWNTLGGATGLKLSSTSTAAASNLQTLFEVNQSGANASSSQLTHAAKFINVKTGTTSTNVAGYFEASGGTANYAIKANGNVSVNGGIAVTGGVNIKGVNINSTGHGATLYLHTYGKTIGLGYGNFSGIDGSIGWTTYGDNTQRSLAVITATYSGLVGSLNIRPGNELSNSPSSDLKIWSIIGSGYTNADILTIGPQSTVFAFDSTQFRGTGAARDFSFIGGGLVVGSLSLTTNAILDLQSTTKAFIPPRMTTTQRDAIGTPSAGMVIYNTTTNKLNVYTSAWEAVTSS